MLKVFVTGLAQTSWTGTARYRYRLESPRMPPYSGVSREPLLDACRVAKRMGEDPGAEIRMYWEDGAKEEQWDLRTTVGYGSVLTIDDEYRTGFRKYKESPYGRQKD